MAFVSCDSEKDPVKGNKAIGKWVCNFNDFALLKLEVKSNKTLTMTISYTSEIDTNVINGTWTAASTAEGTLTFFEEKGTSSGVFTATTTKLTLVMLDVEHWGTYTFVFDKALD